MHAACVCCMHVPWQTMRDCRTTSGVKKTAASLITRAHRLRCMCVWSVRAGKTCLWLLQHMCLRCWVPCLPFCLRRGAWGHRHGRSGRQRGWQCRVQRGPTQCPVHHTLFVSATASIISFAINLDVVFVVGKADDWIFGRGIPNDAVVVNRCGGKRGPIRRPADVLHVVRVCPGG